MKCPVCREVNLVLSERQGVEIDYCPQCRGVWLDRGELDKILERSAPAPRPQQEYSGEHERSRDHEHFHGHERSHGHGNSHGHGQGYRKKKESFLSDLFDF